jgi:hypothetical protein
MDRQFPTVPELLTSDEWQRRTDRRLFLVAGRTLDRSQGLRDIDDALDQYQRSRAAYNRELRTYNDSGGIAGARNVVDALGVVANRLDGVRVAFNAWDQRRHWRNPNAIRELRNALVAPEANAVRTSYDRERALNVLTGREAQKARPEYVSDRTVDRGLVGLGWTEEQVRAARERSEARRAGPPRRDPTQWRSGSDEPETSQKKGQGLRRS